jgi:hypothetical protein
MLFTCSVWVDHLPPWLLLDFRIFYFNITLLSIPVAIIGSRKDGNTSLVMSIAVTLKNYCNLNPVTSITSWCALETNFNLFLWRNCWETSGPKVYPAPLGEIPHPILLNSPHWLPDFWSSGSDHKRSHMGPSGITSWNLLISLMLSRVSIEGERPPCKQKI